MMPRIYPLWIGSFLNAAALEQLKKTNLKIEVVITRPIPYLPLTLSTLLALGLYASEKFWLKNFHAHLPHHLGFRAEFLDLAQCANLADARTLLLASAAAVPITPSTASGGGLRWTAAFTTASLCRRRAKATLKPWCC